jgi:hypothetical protein
MDSLVGAAPMVCLAVLAVDVATVVALLVVVTPTNPPHRPVLRHALSANCASRLYTLPRNAGITMRRYL